MLYISFSSGKTEPWHVTDKAKENLFLNNLKLTDLDSVKGVQADGDELYAIYDICKNTIPMAFRRNSQLSSSNLVRVQNWYGDHAKFIVRNVVLGYEYT